MFGPIGRALRAFFQDDIRIRREQGSLRVALVSPSQKLRPPPEQTQSRADARAAAELQRIRAELAALLDDDPGSRKRMQHLAYVEQQLAIQGLALLDKLSVALLREALKQLEDSVLNWSAVGLATLRSKLAVAVRERGLGHGQDTQEADAALPAGAAGQPAVQVTEASLADSEAALLEAYRAMRDGSLAVPDGEPSSVQNGRQTA